MLGSFAHYRRPAKGRIGLSNNGLQDLYSSSHTIYGVCVCVSGLKRFVRHDGSAAEFRFTCTTATSTTTNNVRRWYVMYI